MINVGGTGNGKVDGKVHPLKYKEAIYIGAGTKKAAFQEVVAKMEQEVGPFIMSKAIAPGMAWENDKVGFRNYFDRRNGMDIFGKVTTEMVLDGVGYKDAPSYHEYNPEWGVDVLKVGNSLGAGSIAYMHDGVLYRVGDNGHASGTVLTEGPLRSSFRLGFEGWQMEEEALDVVHDATITAGNYYYESEVTYTGTDEEVQLVTGIVNM